MIEEACRQLDGWKNLVDDRPFTLPLNLSARQFANRDLFEQLADTFREAGVARDHLQLEITEHELVGERKRVDDLAELGMKLAIDDFGTGYSSLGYLGSLPVDVLKVDGTFLEQFEEDSPGQALIEGVLSLAERMNLRVVAEGIETEEQLAVTNCRHGGPWVLALPVTSPLCGWRWPASHPSAETVVGMAHAPAGFSRSRSRHGGCTYIEVPRRGSFGDPDGGNRAPDGESRREPDALRQCGAGESVARSLDAIVSPGNRDA